MKTLEKYSGLFFGLCGVASLGIMCFVEQKWYSIAGIIVFVGFAIWFAYLFGRRKVSLELENFDKIISDLQENNDAIRMNSITKLISMIESDKANNEIATRISKIISANIKEAIKKLIKMPKRIANDGTNYPIPNRLTDADIESLRLLSLIYDKFEIRANFKAVDVSGLDFTNIELNGADFTQAVFTKSFFQGSSLKSAILTSAYIAGANFNGCQLEDSKFNVSVSDEKNSFSKTNFKGADISTMSSKYTCLSGAQIDSRTILPNPLQPYHFLGERDGVTVIERNFEYNNGKYSD